MAFSRRKMLMMLRYLPKENFTISITCCHLFSPPSSPPPPSPLPPPPAYFFSDDNGKQDGYNIITAASLIRAIVGGLLLAFLVALVFSAVKIFRRSSATVSSDTTGQEDEEERDFFAGNGGNLVDHHVWHIPTVGLQRSVVDSIAFFKFKKSEGLIDGTLTECSICLNEFREDEDLRLLPKCIHAFHKNCIDAWLNSHKNCPSCRAPIILNQIQIPSESYVIDTNSNEPRSSSEPRREEASSITIEAGNGAETDKEDRFNSSGSGNPNFPSRTLSDLGSHRSRASLESVRRCYSIGSSIQRVYDETTRRRPLYVSVKSRSLRIFPTTRASDPGSSGSG